MQRCQAGEIDIANGPALENRPVPCLAADRTSVDQPCVKPLAIGIEPEFAARLEGLEAAATAAGNPRLGSDEGNDGPLDAKYLAHAVLSFRKEVHQDGGRRNLSGARRGYVSKAGGAETKAAVDGTFGQCQAGLKPPPDERELTTEAIHAPVAGEPS